MTTPKHRAIMALAESDGRKFLANAPLMAIVEAVQVLDEAGLLGDSTDRDLRDRLAAEYLKNAKLTEAMAKLDAAEVTAESALVRALAADAENAKSVRDDEGFHGSTLDEQVRELISAWIYYRDEVRRLRADDRSGTPTAF